MVPKKKPNENSRQCIRIYACMLQTYMGKKTIRGVDCDYWRTCLTWPQVNSTFTIDYYFTGKHCSLIFYLVMLVVHVIFILIEAFPFFARCKLENPFWNSPSSGPGRGVRYKTDGWRPNAQVPPSLWLHRVPGNASSGYNCVWGNWMNGGWIDWLIG